MEIWHGGYFDKNLDGTMKYKLDRFNKDGGTWMSWIVSLEGSETEEDEEGNPLPKKLRKGAKLIPWIRFVDLKRPKFRLGHVFPNSEYLKEVVREYGIRNQVGVWFEKKIKAEGWDKSEGASTSANTSNKRKRTNKKPKRAHLPKGCANLKEQVIKSRKTWKKIKETVGGDSTTSVGSSSSTMHQPPTQCSQNADAQRKASKPIPPSQGSSEWEAM